MRWEPSQEAVVVSLEKQWLGQGGGDGVGEKWMELKYGLELEQTDMLMDYMGGGVGGKEN